MEMKGKWPLALLLISPYALLAGGYALLLRGKPWMALVLWALIFLCIFLPAMVRAFWLPHRGWTARRLLFWGMVLKLWNIPFYIGVFFVGLMMSVFVIPLLPFFILLDYFVLLPSTMYGLSGLLQARREGRIGTKTLLIFGIMQFFFCLDVFSAVWMYVSARKWEA